MNPLHDAKMYMKSAFIAHQTSMTTKFKSLYTFTYSICQLSIFVVRLQMYYDTTFGQLITQTVEVMKTKPSTESLVQNVDPMCNTVYVQH